MTYNPEKRVWKGRSYKKGGKRVRALRDRAKCKEEGVKSRTGKKRNKQKKV